MKLILADQRAAKLKYLEHFLFNSGHDVTAVQDGVGCLGSLRQSIPDVLVLAAGLRWGGTDGVLDVMLHSRNMRDTPIRGVGPESLWTKRLLLTNLKVFLAIRKGRGIPKAVHALLLHSLASLCLGEGLRPCGERILVA